MLLEKLLNAFSEEQCDFAFIRALLTIHQVINVLKNLQQLLTNPVTDVRRLRCCVVQLHST